MYDGCVAATAFCAIYFSVFFGGLIIRWLDRFEWPGWLYSGVMTIFLAGVIFCVNEREKVLKRQPVISSCSVISNKGRIEYLMADSTLRCKSGEHPRYSVVKSDHKMQPNEQTPCIHCAKPMVNHVDSSCRRTEQEIESRLIIQDMLRPL